MVCSSGKVGFKSQDEATASTKGIRRQDGISMNSYQCGECGYWHRASRKKDHSLPRGTLRKYKRKNLQKLKIQWKRFWK